MGSRGHVASRCERHKWTPANKKHSPIQKPCLQVCSNVAVPARMLQASVIVLESLSLHWASKHVSPRGFN